MVSASSEGHYLAAGVTSSVKLLVLGPFAVGKTTLVRTVSEIQPLSTEERMTEAGALVDDLGGVEGKETTTVAMDFGRITLTEDIVLYLFGAPGQDRFKPMIEDLMEGALGGIVLVDTARITDSWDAIGSLEEAGLAYVIAVNAFPNSPNYSEPELRSALDLDPSTPLVVCDVREPKSAKDPLIALVSYLLSRSHLELAP
ncbi:GTP-binding protein [Streptomyces nanshensis]|uniref:ATP-binding protein n=1 Tax=Streptomyces nanshensis TaxID=518642 RepID=A0A1E7KZD2_9ACTN|nr:ATP/GTP-binding protein [Streptomyces nanshensis]OEV09282.1 ATP-binding protein [Streptomyces nanshensis]